MVPIAYADYSNSPEYSECVTVVTEFANTGSVPETGLKKKEMKTFINFIQTTVDDKERMLAHNPEDAGLAFELKELEDFFEETQQCYNEMFPISAT